MKNQKEVRREQQVAELERQQSLRERHAWCFDAQSLRVGRANYITQERANVQATLRTAAKEMSENITWAQDNPWLSNMIIES